MSHLFTKSHGLDGKMAATKCVYRDKEYSSASEALEAYIREYEGRSSPPKYTERDVQELLTAAVMKASQRKEGVSVLERETEKMLRMKELVEESYQQLMDKQTGSPVITSTSSSDYREVLSHSQLDSIRGRVQEGYGISDIPNSKFDDFRKTLDRHEETGLKLLSMDDRSDASSIVAGHLASIQPSSKMASTPIHSGRPLDLTKSSVCPSLSLSYLRSVNNFSGYTTDHISTRSRSQSRSNADRSRSLSAAELIRVESPVVDMKHQQYLDNLMCDIEKSSDVVLPETTFKSSANKSVHFWDDKNKESHSSEQKRVQRLIEDPQDSPLCASPTTEEILEGDRSWERIPPVSLDDLVEVGGGEDLAKVTDANIDAILDECVSLVSQHDQEETSVGLTGGSQPGGMEALKNMLFTMQTMTDQVSTSATQAPSETVVKTERMSSSLPLRKQHERKMERAMDSLSRLKSLVNS